MRSFRYHFLLAVPLVGSWQRAVAENSTTTVPSTNPGFPTASATSSSSNSSPSFTLFDNRDSFWFPLVGLSDDTSVPWGVNVSTLDFLLEHGHYDTSFQAFEIAVNDTNPVPSDAPEIYDNPKVVAISNDTINQVGSLVVTTNGDLTLVLGLESSMNYTIAGNGDDLIVPTVPFGLNYGRYGIWNGSIVVGGMYDANRVASSSWTLISESASGNSTFLQDGTLNITASLEFRDVIATFPATLDINADALILPSSYICSQVLVENLVVGIPNPTLPDSTLKIVVPSNLTSATSRCINMKSHDPHNNRVILGRPFFQASYIYVDRESHVYIAAAHQYDLDISVASFDANATLSPAQQPASPTNSPAPNSDQKSAGTMIIAKPSLMRGIGTFWIPTLFSLLASLISIIL